MKISVYKIYYSILAMIALSICFVPLFNILGYESAALFGVVGGILSAFLPVRNSDLKFLYVHIVRALIGLLLPLIILSLNAFRVPNCDYSAGLLFWIFIPVFSVAFGASIGFISSICFLNKWFKHGVSFLVILFTFANFGLRLALEPPITGHQLFLGYFSGSIYDEALSLPTSLVYFRLLSVVIFLTLFLAIRFYRRRAPMRLVVLLVGLVFSILGYYHRQSFNIDVDSQFIQEELGGYIESEHFQIFYPPHDPFVKDIQRIVEDHEFRYAEHARFFNTDPVSLHNKKIKSYIYGSRNQKGRLLGGRRTQVAKLWLHEIHIMWRHYGDHMLAHELAHVFTEPFGNGPLRLSAKYGILGINMGIVEGAATAADWHAPDLDPHLASAALRRLKKAPSLESLLSASGFWTQYSGRVYTLMGSFFRFLIDKYGIEVFKKAYPEGEISIAYGKELKDLVGEWTTFLDGLELTKLDLAKARYRYDRKSIFQKVCARKIADFRVKASNLSHRGRVDEAIEIYQQILDFDPQNLGYKIQYAQFLSGANRDSEAIKILSSIDKKVLSSAQKGQIEELRGDLNWRAKRIIEARKSYEQCLGRGLSLSHARHVEVKTKVLENPKKSAQELGFNYLVSNKYSEIELYFPGEWVRQHPEDPLAHYLLSRRLWRGRMWSEAKDHANEARGKLNSKRLEDENIRILLQSSFFLGDYEEAMKWAETLSSSTLNHYRILSFEWKDRIRQKRGNTIRGKIR